MRSDGDLPRAGAEQTVETEEGIHVLSPVRGQAEHGGVGVRCGGSILLQHRVDGPGIAIGTLPERNRDSGRRDACRSDGDGGACLSRAGCPIPNRVDERVAAEEARIRRIADLPTLDLNGPVGSTADGGYAQQVAIDVGVIGKDVEQHRRAYSRAGAIGDSHRRVVDRSDGDGDRGRGRRQAAVGGSKAERAGAIEVLGQSEAIIAGGRIDRYGAADCGVCHDCISQRAALGVGGLDPASDRRTILGSRCARCEADRGLVAVVGAADNDRSDTGRGRESRFAASG